MTIKEFVKRHRVRISSEYAAENPNMEGNGHEMNNYKVTLRVGRRQMTLYYSMGLGLSGDPTAEDVLDCLASDAAGYENAKDFEDWAGDYGYDTDSRKAERTYNLIGKQAAQLKQLLGEDNYRVLLWETERL